LLSVCIEPLSAALIDPDEKTRANAAGAIGNLIRNGSELCDGMVKAKVPEMLMNMVISDRDATPQVFIIIFIIIIYIQNKKRISLFSLGTMAVYQSARYIIIIIFLL
jgi:hypothetical protein